MYPLGLTPNGWAAYAASLVEHHSIRIGVSVLTLDHQQVSRLDHRIVAGQVNVDDSGSVTRSATVQFFDPDHSLAFDSDSPADGALYADRMLQITYGIRPNVDGAAWVDVPVITGPVVKFERSAEVVDVEIQGKELLAMGAAWRTQTYKKGTPKRDVILSVMQGEGERLFALPEFSSRLPSDRSIARTTVPWEFAKAIAKSTGRQLYYDGAGRLRMRTPSSRSVFTFAAGDGGTILTSPKVSFSIENVRNIVQVVGGVPKGQKKKVRHVQTAARSHPLSPWRLGRNGQPRYLLETIEDSAIRSEAEARRVAQATLMNRLLQNVEVGFDAMVVPHLDPGDHITTQTSDFSVSSRLGTFTIPLTVDGRMSVGYMRRQKIRRDRIR